MKPIKICYMATDNFIVTSLPEYVQTNKDQLLKNFALVGTETRRRGITVQTGVKTKEYINYFEVDPVLQDGSDCGFNASGSITLTQRTVETALIKVNMDVCPKNLLGKYAEYLVKTGAGEQDLPFEQYIVDGLTASLNRKIEKLIWQGDKTVHSSDTDLKWINGWLSIAGSEEDVIDVTIASGDSAYSGIQKVYMALPEEAIERGAEIYVSPSVFRTFMQEMVQLNYYHYSGPQNAAPREFYFPGSDTKVVSTPGLTGDLHVLGTFPKNLVYATDLENNAEEIDIWYSKDNQVFRIDVEWNSGVQFAFPDMVVLGKFAATPSLPATASLAAIAQDVAALNSEEKVFKTEAQS